jgi:malic enzyme
MEEKEVEVKIIYSTYTPAVKECIKRYREKNKEKKSIQQRFNLLNLIILTI